MQAMLDCKILQANQDIVFLEEYLLWITCRSLIDLKAGISEKQQQTDKFLHNIAILREKQKDYTDQVREFEEIWKIEKFDGENSMASVLELETKINAVRNHVREKGARLSAFTDLPPDLDMAKSLLQNKINEFNNLVERKESLMQQFV